MRTVFAVSRGEDHEQCVLAVFEDRAEAHAWVEARNAASDGSSYYTYEVYEMALVEAGTPLAISLEEIGE